MDSRKIVVVAVLGVLGLGLFSTFSAQPSATATLGATTGGSSGAFATVTDLTSVTQAGYKHDTDPTWDAVEDTATDISAGDVYGIDLSSSEYSRDILVTLYITNPDKVSQKYSYWNAKVDAYRGDNTGTESWTENSIDEWISISQGYITFRVGRTIDSTTYDNIDIVIKDGSCYTIDSSLTDSQYDPNFYLTVQQA